MRLTYHPDAEAELIEAAQFYERRVTTLGRQFLDTIDQAVRVIVDAASQPTSALLALPSCRISKRAWGQTNVNRPTRATIRITGETMLTGAQ
jgi:hypothetical protein